jgi:hypothetical protein
LRSSQVNELLHTLVIGPKPSECARDSLRQICPTTALSSMVPNIEDLAVTLQPKSGARLSSRMVLAPRRKASGITAPLMTLSKCANLLGLQVQSDVAREHSPQGWLGV